MNDEIRIAMAKVPEVTIGFWAIKILATTLGETGGDAVSMSMNLGYLVATAIFAAVFAATVAAQIKAKAFHPVVYWAAIIASTTVGTTLAALEFAIRTPSLARSGLACLNVRITPLTLVSNIWS